VNRLFKQRASRPLISHYSNQGEFEEFVRKHLFERQQFYFLANHVLDISNSSPKESLEKLVDLLKEKA
jgi:shikimate kinase